MDYTLPLDFTEADIIDACIDRKKWAQKILYEQYYSPMLGVCMRYSDNKHDALDILHDGFIKVFRHLHRYQKGTSLKAWIRRVMVNTAIDFYRKKIRRRTEEIGEAYTLSSSAADAVSQFSEKEILEAIQKLSPTYRTVFNLYVIEGYSHKEIGEMLGITESTSRSNLVKARQKLRTFIEITN